MKWKREGIHHNKTAKYPIASSLFSSPFFTFKNKGHINSIVHPWNWLADALTAWLAELIKTIFLYSRCNIGLFSKMKNNYARILRVWKYKGSWHDINVHVDTLNCVPRWLTTNRPVNEPIANNRRYEGITIIRQTSRPKASNGQPFPCPA